MVIIVSSPFRELLAYDLPTECLSIPHCRISDSKRMSYLSTNVIEKEFIELDSYYIMYYCPIKTHIEMNGVTLESTLAHMC